MKTVYNLALALAFGTGATAAGAQVAGGVTGQVGAQVEVPDPRPTLEEKTDRVTSTADHGAERAVGASMKSAIAQRSYRDRRSSFDGGPSDTI